MLSDQNVLEVTNLQDEEASKACGTPLLQFLWLIHRTFALLDRALPCISALPTLDSRERGQRGGVRYRRRLDRVWVTLQGEIQG